MTSLHDLEPLTIVGGGPAGSILAIYLAQRGHRVAVYESRPDLRVESVDAGRSINLALATRGIVALEAAGIGREVADITIPMTGRMIHIGDEQSLQPYGTEAHEVIYSVNRSDLNGLLLSAAERTGRVTIHFEHRLRHVDLGHRRLTFSVPDGASGTTERVVEFGLVLGADGANSLVREATLEANDGQVTVDPLDHGYKELTIPPAEGGGFRLDPNALHIWPRGDFMLIALANPEGDFTATLFLPNRPGLAAAGGSFAELDSPEVVGGFFAREFDSFVPLVPDLSEQFFANPTGDLATIRCDPWCFADRSVVLGDAAHAIVPFHGQGMNAAMESAQVLVDCLDTEPDDVASALSSFSRRRKPDADAIADMAIDNYIEMRASVVDPDYLIKRELALELQRRHPDRFTPRYGLVMFTTLAYSAVTRRAARQAEMLAELTAGRSSIDEVDYALADELVQTLEPLPEDVLRPVRLVGGRR